MATSRRRERDFDARARKQDRRTQARKARADGSLAARAETRSAALWTALKATMGIGDRDTLTRADNKALYTFFAAAYRQDMTENLVDSERVVDSYCIDKFEGRADTMACALICAWERAAAATAAAAGGDGSAGGGGDAGAVAPGNLSARHRAINRDAATAAAAASGFRRFVDTGGRDFDDGVTRVASIGGGPGNDAAGFLVFNALALRRRRVHATVYDFAGGWAPLVARVGAACRAAGAAFLVDGT